MILTGVMSVLIKDDCMLVKTFFKDDIIEDFYLFPSSLLERHQGFHDPLRDVVLCRHHCRHHVLCTLLLLWKVQPLLCCRNHVFRLQWVVFHLTWPTHTVTHTWSITDMYIPPSLSAFFVLLGMAIYTGVTVNFLGRRFGDWRFSWSYILGWVAMLMTFFAGEEGQRPLFLTCILRDSLVLLIQYEWKFNI